MQRRSISIITFLIFAGTVPQVHAQVSKRVEKDASAYQALVQRNLDLRKEMGDLEKKYMDLQNERNVLILHVKDLQANRDERTADIEELKGKIAELRVEMLKDPKMVKTIDAMNQKVRDTLTERDELQKRVEILGKEKEKLFNELNVLRDLYAKEQALHEGEEARPPVMDETAIRESEQQKEELRQTNLAFQEKEKNLMAELRQVKADKADLQKKIEGLQSEINKAAVLAQKTQEELQEQTRQAKGEEDQQAADIRKSYEDSEKKLNEEIKSLQAKRHDLENRNKELQERLDDQSRGRMEDSGAQADQLEKIRRESEDRTAALEKTYAQKEKDYQEEVKRLETEIENLVSAADGYEKKLQEAEAKLADGKAGAADKIAAGGAAEEEQSQRQRTRDITKLEAANQDLEKEKSGLLYKVQKLRAAMEQADSSMEEKIAGIQQKEEARLRQERESFTQKEAVLLQRIESVERKNKRLEEELKAIDREAMAEEGKLLDQVKKLEKDNAAVKDELKNEKARVSGESSGLRKKVTRLEVDLEEAVKEKNKIDARLQDAKARFDGIDQENQQLTLERKTLDARLKDLAQQLETQVREAKYDKQYLEQQAKDAKVDKRMGEAKAEDLEERTAAAEKKLKALEEEMKAKEAQTALQESELMVLREEKSKLEQKLIRYIEKVLQDDDARREGETAVLGPVEQMPPKAKKAQSKLELAEQKLKMHYNLALAYDRQGMYREEEREYLKCLKINPKDANVHYNLAILYDDKLNQNERAVEHYNKFLELRPVGEDAGKVKSWMMHAEQEERLGPEMK